MAILDTFKKLLKGAVLFYSLPTGERIEVHKSFQMGAHRKLYISSESALTVLENVTMREFCNIVVESNANLHIGRNVFFNNFCSINCIDRIAIGDDTLIGEGVKIYDHNHQYVTQPNFEVAKDKFVSSPVIIGKNCWIGSNVTILKGVTIGDNVIIGAGCLIYKSIPDNHIVRSETSLLIEPLKNGNNEQKA